MSQNKPGTLFLKTLILSRHNIGRVFTRKDQIDAFDAKRFSMFDMRYDTRIESASTIDTWRLEMRPMFFAIFMKKSVFEWNCITTIDYVYTRQCKCQDWEIDYIQYYLIVDLMNSTLGIIKLQIVNFNTEFRYDFFFIIDGPSTSFLI